MITKGQGGSLACQVCKALLQFPQMWALHLNSSLDKPQPKQRA